MRRFIIYLVFGLAAVNPAAGEGKPNVVLFLIDDLGWGDLGCQGSDYYQTPNIDRLATAGITNGCTATEFCPNASLTRGQLAALLFRAMG